MSAGVGITAAVIGLMSGVLSRSFPSAWPYLFAVLLLWTLFFVVRRVPQSALYVLAIFTITFVCGAARMAMVEERYDNSVRALASFENQDVAFEGNVIRDPESRENGKLLVVELADSSHQIRVSAPRDTNAVYGDRVRVEGILTRPEAFETEFGRMFPYAGYLRAQGITHTVSKAQVEVIAEGDGHTLLRVLFSVKHRFAESVSALLPEPHASLALGLVLGEKHGLGDRLESVFRTVGIIHIIVLSGYNLTIVAEALMRLLTPILLPRPRAIVGAGAIIAFALAVGPGATVVRATVMALLLLFARVSGRTYDALRALLIAGALMILVNPHVLAFDPGFQFSFLATLGLILIGPMIDRLIAFVPSYALIREYAASTIATQIAVAPLLLFSIGAVSVIAVVANVLILVAVPIAMLLVFVAGIIGMITPSFVLAAYPAYLALAYILALAELLSKVPFAEIVVPPFSFSIVVFAYSLLGILVYVSLQRKTHGRVIPP